MEMNFADINDFREDRIHELCTIINGIYHELEAGFWAEGYERIHFGDLKKMITKKELAICSENSELLGCAHIKKLNHQTSLCAMLVAMPHHRGKGVGKKMLRFAEDVALKKGCKTLRMELLSPVEWEHPEKVKLDNWYNRLGYERGNSTPFEAVHPIQAKQLLTLCNYV